MRRKWWQNFLSGEDEFEDENDLPAEEEGVYTPEPSRPVVPDPPKHRAQHVEPPPALDAPPAPERDPDAHPGAAGPLPAPVIAGWEPRPAAPAPAPVTEPPTAVRTIAQWAGHEAGTLLGELPPGARERAAEALQLWHETEVELDRNLQSAQAIARQAATLLSGPLADAEFVPEGDRLRTATEQQADALQALLGGNRARVREWVLSAVQGQRQWSPGKTLRLFQLAGIGPMTLLDLQPRLRSMDAGPRAWAAEALGDMDDPEAGAALLGLLRDPDANVRATAVSALGRKADPTLLPALGAVIKRDPDWLVRLRAIAAAQDVEGYEAIGFLHELLGDANWWRELQVLNAVDRPAGDLPAGSFEKIRGGVVNSILTKVQAALPSADPPHRGWLMEVLGDSGDVRAIPILSSALQDADLDVRLRAIRGLGHIGGAAIVDLIAPCLKDQQPQVRIGAAEALGDANDFRAVPPLLEALKDTNEFVRAAVTVAVGRIIDMGALKPLVAGLNDPDQETRDQTQRAIQRMSDPRTGALLAAILEAGGLRKR
ncbi:MAG TPA: HEAT repeat domain-containing protein [Armatimonadota bacterium]|jgi:HEAT repeat protein